MKKVGVEVFLLYISGKQKWRAKKREVNVHEKNIG